MAARGVEAHDGTTVPFHIVPLGVTCALDIKSALRAKILMRFAGYGGRKKGPDKARPFLFAPLPPSGLIPFGRGRGAGALKPQPGERLDYL